MSRRRDRRDRRQDDTSDRSKRILQISLVSVGVLLLLIALVIAVGLPMGTSLLANDVGSGDNGGNGDTGETKAPATTSTESKSTPQEDQASTTTTEEKTSTEKQTTTTEKQTTTTKQTQQPPQNSGQMRVVKTKDRDGDGFVSEFSLEVNIDTTRNKYKDRNLRFVISINGERVDTTDKLDPNANGYVINLDRSTLRNYQPKQGSMRVTIKLIDRKPGESINLNTWTTQIRYEPKENPNN